MFTLTFILFVSNQGEFFFRFANVIVNTADGWCVIECLISGLSNCFHFNVNVNTTI